MRVWSRIALVVVVLFPAFVLKAEHYQAQCPLSLAGTTAPTSDFALSPHAVFRSDDLVYVLRGQTLLTYSVNDTGELELVREDFIDDMASRETEGGVAFSDGYLFVSGEAGLEIFDLSNVRVGGNAPSLVSRTAGLHYRRIAVSGNRLAGLYPSTDLPCYPTGSAECQNAIDIVDITNLANPVRVGMISSRAQFRFRGFNDIAFNYGSLIALSEASLLAFDITNAASPTLFADRPFGGDFLISNGSNWVAIGNDETIDVYSVRPGVSPYFLRIWYLTIPSYLTIGRSNPIRFSRHAWYDDQTGRLFTLIDEVDPMTLKAARTIAFDVFDFSVPTQPGSVERIYEDVTLTNEDEVKYNPVAIGNNLYVVGGSSGVQSWGSCGVAAGRIEMDSPLQLTCGGGEIHGWVTGQQRITGVELFLDDTLLGNADLASIPRTDVSSTTPVLTWRLPVNLDLTARGSYQLRALATDALQNRRQFASRTVFFPGPGENCTTPRRRAVR